MNEIKRQLDKKMGDTTMRTQKIINMVEQNKQRTKKKSSVPYYATFIALAALLVVMLYVNPFETKAPTTSTPTPLPTEPSEQSEPIALNLKSFFKQDGDVAYFIGLNNEYASFSETTTWLNDEYVLLSIDNSAIVTRKFYRVTDEAIYLVFEDQPEMDGDNDITIEKLEQMTPIKTLFTANLKDDPDYLVTYPTELNTPLQYFENVVQLTEAIEYGTNDYYYAEGFGLIGQTYTTNDGEQIFSLLASINEQLDLTNISLNATNSETNEQETLYFSELFMNSLLLSRLNDKDSPSTYTPIHKNGMLELGIVEMDIPHHYTNLTVIRSGDTINVIGFTSLKLIDWRFSPDKKRVALYYSNGHEWKNTDNYEADSLQIVNLQDMHYELAINEEELALYAYPILSYEWKNDTTLEIHVPDVSSTQPALFVEWKVLNREQTKTLQAKFVQPSLSLSKTAHPSDFDTYFYEGERYTLYLHEGQLTISGFYFADDRKSILDEIVLAANTTSPFFEQTYENAKVEVQDNRYIITADGIPPLEFTIFIEDIIMDSFGASYIRTEK